MILGTKFATIIGGNSMIKKPLHVYQFKISLLEIKPLIWRRIQVLETYTFWDLHVAIQDAMGWTDSHLHEFNILNLKTMKNTVIGYPDEMAGIFDEDRVILPGWKQNIRDFFSLSNPNAKYEYDFGDCWEHDITLEAILPKDPQSKYPQCLDGARSCPPQKIAEVIQAMRNYPAILENTNLISGTQQWLCFV